MSITVLRPGMLTTLQDRGRQGYQKYGVLVSGAMDEEALRLGNIIIGNEQGEAALEITMIGPVLKFTEDTLISLTGADLEPRVDGKAVPMWRPVVLKSGSILRFGRPVRGSRTYLCLSGGYDVPLVMGSKSTYLRAAMGGYQGRALAADDVLETSRMPDCGRAIMKSLKRRGNFITSPWYVQPAYELEQDADGPIRLTPGLQYRYFTEESRQKLVHEGFAITVHADRMGYRMKGSKLELTAPLEMISEAAVKGTVQVPADGNAIILMADRQSTAGYPKIGQVVLADMGRLAQSKPGEVIYFSMITPAQAEALYIAREEYIDQIALSIQCRFE
jgi:antagonist of KipI